MCWPFNYRHLLKRLGMLFKIAGIPFRLIVTAGAWGMLLSILGFSFISHAQGGAQEESTTAEAAAIPVDASIETLTSLITDAKQVRPASLAEFRKTQTVIRDASKRLLELLEDEGRNDSADYGVAEFDSMSASLALMSTLGADAQEKTLQQTIKFLEAQKHLSDKDMQLAIVAATYLDQHPNKQPVRKLYEFLTERLQDDKRPEMQAMYHQFQASIRRLELLGKKLELDAQDVTGNRVSIDAYNGKYLLVCFFTTWNAPCKQELERVKAHYRKYNAKGLEVVAVSLDSDRKLLDAFLVENPFPWPTIHDGVDHKLQLKFGISALPTVLLLNKHGEVVSLAAQHAELDRLTEMLFETPTPAPPLKTEGSAGQ